jgi:hypothetical protein
VPEEEAVVDVCLNLVFASLDQHGHVDDVIVELLPNVVHVLVNLLYAEIEALLVIGPGIAMLPVKCGIGGFAVVIIEEKFIKAQPHVVEDELSEVLVVGG